MTGTTSRDRDASGFTAWLYEAATRGGPIGELVATLSTAPGAQGRDFTPDELFDYLMTVGASRAAFDVVIPASQASGYPLRDGKQCPITQDREHRVHPFRQRPQAAPTEHGDRDDERALG